MMIEAWFTLAIYMQSADSEQPKQVSGDGKCPDLANELSKLPPCFWALTQKVN